MNQAVARVYRPNHELLLKIRAEAERAGLVLVTDGHDLAYTLPHHIPDGWTPFAVTHPDSARLDAKEPKA